MRLHPALQLTFTKPADPDRIDAVLAILDDFSPAAIEDRDDGLRAFFATADARNAAQARLVEEDDLVCKSDDVSDEDWAARSQAQLTPVTVGALTIAPPWTITPELRESVRGPILAIQPSMGFGTGHHASTRLCLRQLQQIELQGLSVLDIGTGSGVLAVASAVLGAARIVAVDVDPDALTNAQENLALNQLSDRIQLRQVDFAAGNHLGAAFDVIVANLTGGILSRQASVMRAFARQGARIISSGFQTHELDEVTNAFKEAGWSLIAHDTEQDWVGATFA